MKLQNLFEQNTASQIIKLLKENPGLRSNQIFLELQKNGNKTSYQNVHKTLKLLKTKSVLEEKDRRYFISEKWIKRMENYANFLKN